MRSVVKSMIGRYVMRDPSPSAPESCVSVPDAEVKQLESSGQEKHAALSAALREVKECLPMLPVMAAQLQEVSRQTEESVVRVCESFQAMAQRARQAVSQLSSIGSGPATPAQEDREGIQGRISSARETMGALLGRIEQTSEFSNLTVDRMQTMERQIGDLNKTLHQIDEVAKNARLLALNGQLEAARAGEHGTAFSVVAKETASMADHAVASSKTIRSQINAISASIESSSSELRERASADTQAAARSREEVLRELDAMAALHEGMQRAVADSRANSEQLARDISAAVMAMQFQDTVCQRIGHVVHTLEQIHRVLDACTSSDAAAPRDAGPRDDSARNWAARMTQQYTMASERDVFAAHASGNQTTENDSTDNVELF